jgi:hypothetical protein
MTVVLEKVRRLERYVLVTNVQTDEVLESTLDRHDRDDQELAEQD